MPNEKKRTIAERLRDRYRLVILNDTSFEEKFAWKLTPMALFIAVSATIIFLIVLVISIIAFTPLREYIPGYADINMRRSIINMAVKTDSLQQELALKTLYIENIKNVISGNIKPDSIQNKPDSTKNYKALINSSKPSIADSIMRAQVESKEKYSLSTSSNQPKNNGIAGFFFFTPLKGTVTSSFNLAYQHYGVDVVAKENEAIKSTLDGTVISAGWTTESGYTMQVQHSNNLISVYKHCSALMKKTGDYIKAGEVIGIVGNSGEQTTGPHLHFELWYNGTAIDPQEYMIF